MTSEVRHIFFSEAEVSKALILLEKRRDDTVFSDIRSIEYDTEKEVVARVIGPDGSVRTYPGSALAAALLLFCSANAIMVPRSASKSLRVERHELVLCLTLGRNPSSVSLMDTITIGS